ncbi:MAG: hypothetical protein WCG20_03970 [bacterium]
MADKKKFDAAYTKYIRAKAVKDEASQKAALETMITESDNLSDADLARCCSLQTGKHKYKEALDKQESIENGTVENNTTFNKVKKWFS